MDQQILEFLKSVQVIFSIALVVASSGASIAVAIINTRGQRKLRDSELVFRQKSEIYFEFIDVCNELIVNATQAAPFDPSLHQRYAAATHKVSMVSPYESMSSEIAALNKHEHELWQAVENGSSTNELIKFGSVLDCDLSRILYLIGTDLNHRKTKKDNAP